MQHVFPGGNFAVFYFAHVTNPFYKVAVVHVFQECFITTVMLRTDKQNVGCSKYFLNKCLYRMIALTTSGEIAWEQNLFENIATVIQEVIQEDVCKNTNNRVNVNLY